MHGLPDYPYNSILVCRLQIRKDLLITTFFIEWHPLFQAVSTGTVPWVFIFRDINNLMPNLDAYRP
jgi:hypothetical protein